MDDEFLILWISCLYESMSKWINSCTYLGFMVFLRNTCPYGNYYHTICWYLIWILFALDMVKGKDQHPESTTKAHSEFVKRVVLCLRLTKSLKNSGKGVVINSIFCVLNSIIKLKKRCILSSELIKKRVYWSRYVKDRFLWTLKERLQGTLSASRGNWRM